MNARPSIPTPTWAFGSFSVRRHRSTTVRPRQSSDPQSIVDVAVLRLEQIRAEDVRERHGVVDRASRRTRTSREWKRW